jgi:hypothetical protein
MSYSNYWRVFFDSIFTEQNNKIMKRLFILALALSTALVSQSQNVGIGTSTPAYPLTVQANSYGIVQTNGTVKLGLYSFNTTASIGTISNHNLHFFTNNDAVSKMTITTNGQVGIGNSDPAYKLDLEGRMRIRTSPDGTAGIWFGGVLQGNVTPRSFIGSIDEDHVGIYGNDGAGWKFSFNVKNGFVGVGTSAPTANLDVNGSIRMRGTFPKKGSVLTSDDAIGNANWADPIAFKATGGFNNQPFSMSGNTWTKIVFNQTASYNLGLSYQAFNSQFVVPENGIYHFDVQLEWTTAVISDAVKIMRNRGGSISVLAFKDNDGVFKDGTASYRVPSVISGDFTLQANDIIWIEALARPSGGGSSIAVSADAAATWFNGHLVARF